VEDWLNTLLLEVPPQVLGIAIVGTLYVLRVYISWIDRARYRLLFQRWTPKKLRKLHWEKFELLAEELLKYQGWKTERTVRGADGGVDIWAKRHRTKRIVQCKRYKTNTVTIQIVREQYGLLKEYEADEVMIATSSTFTKECYLFTKDKPNYLLLDGNKMALLLTKIKRESHILGFL